MKIVIELEMAPYNTVSEDPNDVLFTAVDKANAAAHKLAGELPTPATVEGVKVER